VGIQLITHLPENMANPDMTAHWESQLNAISQREMKYAHFMEPMTQSLHQLIEEVGSVQFQGLRGQGKALTQKRKRKKAS
jgi:DNA topoisomerase-3